MNLNKVSDRIYYLPPTEETDRPTLGYIRGDKYSLMIDAGNSSRHVDIFNNALKKENLSIPDYVAITHWHWDHTYAIPYVDGKVIATTLTNNEIKKMMKWKWTDSDMKKRLESGEEIEFCDKHIRLEYPDLDEIKVQEADIVFDNSLTLDLGGVHAILTHVGGPHSEDSVFIYVPEEKTLFVGDADCGDYYGNEGKYDRNRLEEYISLLDDIPFETYIHGHIKEPLTRKEAIKCLKEELLNL